MKRLLTPLLVVAPACLAVSACGYQWQRAGNAYPPSSTTPIVTAAPTNIPDPQSVGSRSPLMRGEYIVRPGDTAPAIAQQQGVALADLARWNQLDGNLTLYPGQLLRTVAPTADAASTYQAVASPQVQYGVASVPDAPYAAATIPSAVPSGQGFVPDAPPAPRPTYAAPVVSQPVTAIPDASVRSALGTSIIAPVKPGVSPALRQPFSNTPSVAAAPAVPAVTPAVVTPPAVVVPKPAAPVSVAPPKATSSSKERWMWPVGGAVIRRYAPAAGSKGVDVSTDIGTPVKAAAAGRVAYAGSAIKAYGQLVVIKHDEVYLTAYGFNSKLLVREGDQVSAGQAIAESGQAPDGATAVHFEIRENGNPIDPLPLLPAR